ncbi:MAG: hypothetical protein ABI651_14385 [Verrucomicrobiota bacterium]
MRCETHGGRFDHQATTEDQVSGMRLVIVIPPSSDLVGLLQQLLPTGKFNVAVVETKIHTDTVSP